MAEILDSRLSIHDAVALEEYARRRCIDRHHLRRLRNTFYKRHADAEASLQELSAEKRVEFERDVSFHALRLHSRHDSNRDGASKLIFQTAQSQLLESVILRIATGRTTLCVSTQVGCAARCGFCATGAMGVSFNLSASEILDQVIQANRIVKVEKRSVRNVVFMGMGEPFHNEDALHQALETLCAPSCFGLSAKRLLVSTVGIPDAMVRCASLFRQVGLALSLHSARQHVRERLIPLARHYRLAELRDTLAAVADIQRQPVMIEYLMLKDLNDTSDDVQALADFLAGIPVHINLIPYNPIESAPELAGTPPVQINDFAAALREIGFTVTVRYSLGADISAACGQLAHRETARKSGRRATVSL